MDRPTFSAFFLHFPKKNENFSMKLGDPMGLQCQNPFSWCFFINNYRFLPTFWKYLLHLTNPIKIVSTSPPARNKEIREIPK